MLAATFAMLLGAAPIQLHAEQSQLSNGLTVILAEDHQVPGVAVLMTYKVGSRDEAPGRTGFAHLFEHLMFMGSVHVPYPQFDTIQESHGGQNNADTGNDHTRYYEWGPSNLLETFVWQEADRLATLPDAMTEEKVSKQREVVLNERRESYENQPYGMAEISIAEHIFPAGHPYHWPVIGYPKDLQAATKDDVVAFFKRFYRPSNAILTIVGDFQSTQAHAWVEHYFGWMPGGSADRSPGPPAPVLEKPEAQELLDKVELPKAVLAWHSPAADTAGDSAAQLLAEVLAGSKSSRLYRSLVYEQQIAQDVSADQSSMKLGSIFEVELLASPGHSAQEQIAAFDQQLDALAERGPTEAELDAAKLDVRTSLARSAEPLVSRALLMERLDESFGDPTAVDRELARFDNQTVNTVRDAARALKSQNRFTLTFKPAKGESP